MTDTTTETRALIARVRDDIAPADQPQALRDLARTADGEPRVDAVALEREAIAAELERRARTYDAEGGGSLVAYALRSAAVWVREGKGG